MKTRITEGLIDSIVNYVVDRLLHSYNKEFYNAIRNSPELKLQKEKIRASMDDAQRSVERVKHSIQEFEKTKKAYEAKYGEGSYAKNLKKYGYR
jgi:hypothetical protein